MPQYLRAFIPEGTFFFTVTRLEHRRKLLTEPIDDLRAVLKAARQRRPFTVEAIIIFPDHLHCIWKLPFTVTYDAGNITLRGRRMMTFGV